MPADAASLRPITGAVVPDAGLKTYLEITAVVDRVPDEQRALPVPTLEYGDTIMAPAYAALGITLVERAVLGRRELARLESTWARRIAQACDPQALYVRGLFSATPLPAAPRSPGGRRR